MLQYIIATAGISLAGNNNSYIRQVFLYNMADT